MEVIDSEISVFFCNETGLPKSPASLIVSSIGISPKKGTSKSTDKFLAPDFPKMKYFLENKNVNIIYSKLKNN